MKSLQIMPANILGLHHVTAIVDDAQKNYDFYTSILGFRLIKRTVNFDDPGTYHFYYGDESGTPGNILTFFPYNKLRNGRQGKGMINTIAFSVPVSSMNFWLDRLKSHQISYKNPQERFDDEVVVYFEDPSGLGLEFVFNNRDQRPGFNWGHIPQEHAIKGFYNIEIWEDSYVKTGALLTNQLEHQIIGEKGNRIRYAVNDQPGSYVDVLSTPDSLSGFGGSGTVHHLAFATATEESQLIIHDQVSRLGLSPTPVRDRSYFKSIYFREPGGVLLEIATRGPGFTFDESTEILGNSLRLPENFEWNREQIEHQLPFVNFTTKNTEIVDNHA